MLPLVSTFFASSCKTSWLNARQTLSICVSLCESGVNPEALAAVVKELRKEGDALKVLLCVDAFSAHKAQAASVESHASLS
jgi:hypothetical protein